MELTSLIAYPRETRFGQIDSPFMSPHGESFDMTHFPLNGIRAVIFDLGGTLYSLPASLFETHKRFLREICGDEFEVSTEAFEAAHHSAEREVSARLVRENAPVDHSFSVEEWIQFDRTILHELGVTEDLEEKAVHYQLLWDEMLSGESLVMKPHAREVLEELNHRGYKLAVATNWEQNPRELLKSTGVLYLFQSVQYTMIRGFGKPSPYMPILNAHEMGVNPLNCALVGDSSRKDVRAARRAGMRAVLIVPDSIEDPDIPEDVEMIRGLRELLSLFPGTYSRHSRI
jgi:HAD superfamily hydrolase (TIGR01509 family)